MRRRYNLFLSKYECALEKELKNLALGHTETHYLQLMQLQFRMSSEKGNRNFVDKWNHNGSSAMIFL